MERGCDFMKKRKMVTVICAFVLFLIVLSFAFIVKIGDHYYFTYTQIADVACSSEAKDYNSLSRLKNLRELSVADSPIKDTEFLKNMPELEKLSLLSIADTERKSVDLTNISRCPELNDIFLRLTRIDSLRYFSNLTKLKDLYLYGGRNRIDLNISNCENLENIRLENFDIPDLRGIENARNLKTLEILYCSSEDTDDVAINTVNLDPIKELSELKTLMIVRFNYPIDISALDKCQKLKCVDLTNCELVNSDFEIFSKMPALEELDITGIRMTNFSGLAKSKTLRKIVVSNELYTNDEIAYLIAAGIDVVTE